jgi:hypothetical protein
LGSDREGETFQVFRRADIELFTERGHYWQNSIKLSY